MADKDFVVKNGLIVNGSVLAVNTATGSVGINTTNPDSTFKVVGTANVTGNATFRANVTVVGVMVGNVTGTAANASNLGGVPAASYALNSSVTANATSTYASATAFASDATNITTGTLNNDRLPASINVATALGVGVATSMNTSTVRVGSVVVNSTFIAGSPSAQLNVVNATAFSVGTAAVVNASGVTTTNVVSTNLSVSDTMRVGANVTVNTSAITVGPNFAVNSTHMNMSSVRIVANGSIGTPGQTLISNGTTTYWGVTSGYAGSVGFTGSLGFVGSLGYNGSQGDRGYSGSQGDPGVRGFSGSIGVGFTGSVGVGYAGSVGFVGSRGFSGSVGAGFTGSIGSLGYTGSVGAYAAIGFTGSQGTAGAQGAQGPQGPQGLQGYTGATGPQGPQGFQGAQGPQGPQGPAGPIGGSNTQIIFNDRGSAAGSSQLRFDVGLSRFYFGGDYLLPSNYNYGYSTWQGPGSSIWISGNQIQLNPQGSATIVAYTYGGKIVGQLEVTGAAAKPGGGTWDVYSDARLKKDIVKLDKNKSVQNIMSLNPVNYQWNVVNESMGRTAGIHKGFIAQEMETIYPESISEIMLPDMDKAYKTVGFKTEFFTDLVAVNQYLITKVEELQSRLDILEKDLGV